MTEALGREHPGDVPEVVATDADRGWMLMRELDGKSARGLQALDGMRVAARIQRAWLGRERELGSFGCRQRGLDELRSEAPQLAPLCDELEALGIPDTLVHGDLHHGNMLVSGERTAVIDWSDAAIGHPFLDLAPALWIGEEHRDALADAYLEGWSEFGTKDELLRAAAIGEALGCVYQAISYRAINAAFEPADRWLFAEVLRASGSSEPNGPRESAPARVDGGVAELLLDAQQLVVLRDAVGARRRTGLDLAGAGRDGQVGDRRVLRLAGAVRDDARVTVRARELDRVERLGQRADLVDLDQDRVARRPRRSRAAAARRSSRTGRRRRAGAGRPGAA